MASHMPGALVVLTVILSQGVESAPADVVAYECNQLPGAFGWEDGVIWCDPDLSIENGWLIYRDLVTVQPFAEFGEIFACKPLRRERARA